MKNYWVFGIFLSLAMLGCTYPSRVAMKPGVDFSKIQRLVLAPSRAEDRSVADELARQLVGRGYSVRWGEVSTGDAILEVNVSQWIPDKKYLVQTATGASTVAVITPVTEIGGRSLYPGFSPGAPSDTQVLVSNATVSFSAQLLDPSSREILWTGSIHYEGLDLATAIEGAVGALLRRFPAGPSTRKG